VVCVYVCLFASGSLRELDVIDVSRQDDLRMKMREWTEYYEDRRSRNKVLNVISLEFTGSEWVTWSEGVGFVGVAHTRGRDLGVTWRRGGLWVWHGVGLG